MKFQTSNFDSDSDFDEKKHEISIIVLISHAMIDITFRTDDRKTDDDALRRRLTYLYVNRNQIRKLKIDNAIYSCFRRNVRFARITNELNLYRFFHRTFIQDSSNIIDIFENISAQEQHDWIFTENVVLFDLFRRWFDNRVQMIDCFETSIEELVLNEFEMYRHHFRRMNNRDNFDWQRNQFYFIAQ